VANYSTAAHTAWTALWQCLSIGVWSRQTAMETGAIVSLACVVPLLAMGMSISDDAHRKIRHANNGRWNRPHD